MKLLITFFLSICFLSATAQTVGSNISLVSDSLVIDGNTRTFHFLNTSLKENNQEKPQPSLIFVLHGSGGNGKGMMNGSKKLASIAAKENFVLVYPDGYKNFWNECRKMATSAANLEDVNDNKFFHEMISYFTSKHNVNPERVFAVGTSGGGHMAYKLALTMPEKFRAISAIIANLPDSSNMDCIERKSPITVMIINGTSDEVNPYNGGEVKITGTKLGTVRSTDQTFRYWAQLSGYKGKPAVKKLPDTDPSDGKTIQQFCYKKKGKPEVTLLKVENGKHDYPNDIDVHVESWNFFKRQFEF